MRLYTAYIYRPAAEMASLMPASPRVQRSDGFVVQTGDPAAEGRGEAHGYVPASGVFSPHQLAPISPASADRPPHTWGSILGRVPVFRTDIDTHSLAHASGGAERRIPLEVIVKGDKQPMYGATFDEDGRGGCAFGPPRATAHLRGRASRETAACCCGAGTRLRCRSTRTGRSGWRGRSAIMTRRRRSGSGFSLIPTSHPLVSAPTPRSRADRAEIEMARCGL